MMDYMKMTAKQKLAYCEMNVDCTNFVFGRTDRIRALPSQAGTHVWAVLSDGVEVVSCNNLEELCAATEANVALSDMIDSPFSKI